MGHNFIHGVQNNVTGVCVFVFSSEVLFFFFLGCVFFLHYPVRSGKTQLTIRICFSKGAARLDLSSVALKKHHIYSKFVAKGGAAGVVNQNVRADVRPSVRPCVPFYFGPFSRKNGPYS